MKRPVTKSCKETTGEIMRNYRTPGLLAITCIVLLMSFAESRADDTACESTDYELMSLFINVEYDTIFSLILINRETEEWCLGGNLGVILEEWPELKSETIDALIVNNRSTTCRLDERFRIPVEYRLLSEQEYVKVLQEDRILKAGGASLASGMQQSASADNAAEPDWDNFDRVFPDAQGYLTFSKAGFDSENKQALLIFSNSYRCSGVRMRPATRKIAFFMKRKGAWELVGISRGISSLY
jgi:hypothetical protein